jgi:hypothetical protein
MFEHYVCEKAHDELMKLRKEELIELSSQGHDLIKELGREEGSC